MAKFGSTLVANTNMEAMASDATRMSIAIVNASSTDTIYVEFGAAASTVATDDSWIIPPQGSLFLTLGEWPEIAQSVNLKSTGTPSFVVRTTSNA